MWCLVTRALWVVGRQLFNGLNQKSICLLNMVWVYGNFLSYIASLIPWKPNSISPQAARCEVSFMFAVCLCKGTCLFVCSVLIQQTFMNMKHGERELQSDICQKSANSLTAHPSRPAFTGDGTHAHTDLTCWQVQTVHGLQRPESGAFTRTH